MNNINEIIDQQAERIRAFIVAVVSQKGGTGKTALDCQFAIALALRGLKTCVVDMDEDQYSAAKLLTRRKNNNLSPEIPFYIATPATLKEVIKKISKDFDVIFIESTGKVTTELKYAISLADMIISPLEPVEESTDTIPKLEATLKEFIEQNIVSPNIRAFFVPNKVSSQQRAINFENEDNPLVKMLNLAPYLQYFKFTKNFIKHRPSIYPKCYSFGKGILELKGQEVNPKNSAEGEEAIKKASEENIKLLEEIFYVD